MPGSSHSSVCYITYGEPEPSCYFCLRSGAQLVRTQGGATKYVCSSCLDSAYGRSSSSSSSRGSSSSYRSSSGDYESYDDVYQDQGPQYDVHRSYRSSRRSSYRGSSGRSSPSSYSRSYYSSY